MRIAVTGACGRLGRLVVRELLSRRHEVIRLSSRPGAGDRYADLSTGEGLVTALAGAEVIVHTASAPRGDYWQTDAAGAGRIAEAVNRANFSNLVFVSIVGVDVNPFAYYRAKLAAEKALLASGLPVSVFRVTQFHDFISEMCATARLGPVLGIPAHWRLAPIDCGEVAGYLADAVEQEPTRGVRCMAGPQIVESVELARTWAAVQRRKPVVIPLPVPGKISRAFRDGAALTRVDIQGIHTYAEHLENLGSAV